MVHNETLHNNRPFAMHPKKFAFWLGLVSIIMFFAALTSAYIVRKADLGWNAIELPQILVWSTVVIVVSSVFIQLAYKAAKENELSKIKLFVGITFVLGVAFLAMQWNAFVDLVDRKIYFTGPGSKVSAQYLYLLTVAHAAHIISGLIFLLIALSSAFRFKIHSKNMLMIESCTTYWHFLGILWVYLYFFVLFV